MKYIIVITGASSGFGELTVRALAKADISSMPACGKPLAAIRNK
jgi:NADP-dependent 3-hydroxy acid dehydrogenase YdfG